MTFTPPPVAPLSDSMARIVAAIRRSMAALHMVHPAHEDPAIVAHAEALADGLQGARESAREWAEDVHATRSPLSGTMNPIAPPISYEYDPDNLAVTGRCTMHIGYQGPPGRVHGGHVAAILDDVLGRTRHLTGRHCVTGTLNIRYEKATLLNAELVAHARITEMHDRKFIVTGEITCEGEVTARAEAVFVFLSDEKFTALVPGTRVRPTK